MKPQQLITNKKFLIVISSVLFLGLIIFLVFFFNRPSDTLDADGNRYTSNGDIYYAEEAQEEPNVEPELHL